MTLCKYFPCTPHGIPFLSAKSHLWWRFCTMAKMWYFKLVFDASVSLISEVLRLSAYSGPVSVRCACPWRLRADSRIATRGAERPRSEDVVRATVSGRVKWCGEAGVGFPFPARQPGPVRPLLSRVTHLYIYDFSCTCCAITAALMAPYDTHCFEYLLGFIKKKRTCKHWCVSVIHLPVIQTAVVVTFRKERNSHILTRRNTLPKSYQVMNRLYPFILCTHLATLCENT